MSPNIAQQVDDTFFMIVGISIVLLIGITVTMIYFVIKYSRKRNRVPVDIKGNIKLEIIWTVVPTILVLMMFFSGYWGFKSMRTFPPDAFTIKVIGRMWSWSYEYPNGKKSDTLYVPLSKPVKMDITSVDVNHSFYLPDFRVKEDAVPGRVNNLWFQPLKTGEYTIMCAEYCGLNHSYMYSKLIVMEDNNFYDWYNYTPVEKDSVKSDSLRKN